MDAPIVVAVDLSQASQQALALAAALATGRGAPLLIVHASEVPRVPAYGMSLGASDEGWSQIEEDAQATQQARLEEWVAPLRRQGLGVDVMVGGGPPEELVEAAATRNGAQLIVVGRHGRSGVRRLVLGSVAEAILRRATVPVLVVPVR